MDNILGNTNQSPDLPSTIGHDPNDSWETPELVRPGGYDNTRSERGNSVDSGRGSLSNDCVVKAAAHLPQPDSFPLTRADIARSGEPGGQSTADLRTTSAIFNPPRVNPYLPDAKPSAGQSFPPLPNCPITEVR